MKRRRWLPIALGAVLAAAIVAGLWPDPRPVETAKATRGPLRVTINEEGKTRIARRFTVSAPVAGELRRIGLRAADAVEAGAVVAVIDPVASPMLDARGRALAEARRDVAAANLEKARAAHAFQAAELKRFRNLYTAKMVTLQEYEAAQWRESSAAKEVAAFESALRQAEVELAEFAGRAAPTRTHAGVVQVKAPASGRVLRVFEESARPVAAGTPLVELGDPAQIEAVITVLSRDGAAIAPGTPVELDHWGGPRPLAARVRHVEPAAFTKVSALGVEEQRVNVVADILAPPAERPSLGDNYRVEGRIVVWQSERALKVPAGALVRRGDGWQAFVVRGGRAHAQPVRAGRSSGAETEVLEGLAEGDEVILYPGDRTADGERVKPVPVSGR